MTYKIAIIGAGNIAKRHAYAIKEINVLDLVAVADVNKEKAKDLAQLFKANAYQDYQTMLKKEAPDMVVISVPHFLHKEVAVHTAAHGCHILVEKPMAVNVEECDQIITACNKNQVSVLVCHTQQYMAENKKAKEIIKQGILGDLIMVNDRRYIYYFNKERPEWFFHRDMAGGGIVINMGVHSIDKIQWVTDRRVSYVKSSLSEQNFRGDIEGSGLIYLELENETSQKIPATVALSGYQGQPVDETEFICTHGKLKLMNRELFIDKYDSVGYRKVEVTVDKSPSVLQLEDLINLTKNQSLNDSYNHYARSLIQVIESVYTSHQKNKEVKIL